MGACTEIYVQTEGFYLSKLLPQANLNNIFDACSVIFLDLCIAKSSYNCC